MSAVQLLHARVLGGSSQLAQLWFDARVLEKYRSVSGSKIMRTDTAGRLKLPAWGLDFGIVTKGSAVSASSASGTKSATTAGASTANAYIHVSLGDAQTRIPQGEREHWAAHAVTLPVSTAFVSMQITRGACVDDGELRSW